MNMHIYGDTGQARMEGLSQGVCLQDVLEGLATSSAHQLSPALGLSTNQWPVGGDTDKCT